MARPTSHWKALLPHFGAGTSRFKPFSYGTLSCRYLEQISGALSTLKERSDRVSAVDQLIPCEACVALYRRGEWRPGSLHHWPHRVQSSVPWYQGEPSEFSGTLGSRSSAPLWALEVQKQNCLCAPKSHTACKPFS